MKQTPTNDKRGALDPLPISYVCDPSGRIRAMRYGPGVCHEMIDGNGRVTPAFEAKGWINLDTAYAQEGRPELMAVYLDCQLARLQNRRAKFPDTHLPAIVIERRGRRTELAEWVAPPLEEIIKPKRKRGAA